MSDFFVEFSDVHFGKLKRLFAFVLELGEVDPTVVVFLGVFDLQFSLIKVRK